MRRRCALAYILLAMAPLLLNCSESAPARPNLILITTEGLPTQNLACYGRKTQRGYGICALGETGARFVWAFSPTLETTPAAATLLTGQSPDLNQVDASVASFLRSSQVTLPELLKEGGYSTAAFIANPKLNRARNLNQGFDLYADRVEAASMARTARQWVRQNSEPWFVWFHLSRLDPSVHQEFPIERPATPIASDEAGLQRLDQLTSEIVALLSDEGRPPGILFAGLHSQTPRARKKKPGNLDPLRVPLFWRAPESSSGPGVSRRITRPVSLMDVAPTLIEAAGLATESRDALAGQPFPYTNSEETSLRALRLEDPDAVWIIRGAEYARFPKSQSGSASPESGRLWPKNTAQRESTPAASTRDYDADRIQRLSPGIQTRGLP